MQSVGCRDIGIMACDFRAKGTTGRQLLEAMIKHLGMVHGFEIPLAALENEGALSDKEPERMLLARLQNRIEAA